MTGFMRSALAALATGAAFTAPLSAADRVVINEEFSATW